MTMDMDVGHSYEDEDPPQVTKPHANQGEVELDLDRDSIISSYPRGMADTVLLKAKLSENKRYTMMIGSQSQGNIYAPFTSSLDWEVARWAKIHSPSSTSFTELMVIEGVEQWLGLSFKNARELNQMINTPLPGRPPLLFAPKRHYADEEKSERMYHDMHTGSWWWKMQTSSSAYVLLGYLPMNKAKRKRLIANLYHACMWHILEPLVSAGKNGVFMFTAAGDVYLTHPIFASFIGDYPEQTSSQIHMKLVPHPFWLELPHSNIYRSITPNMLHQLYQGIFKHLKMWILSACDPAEIDAQCQ
ncbi:hypothetical protein EI94DRAFT_1698606 [Lactarius quietus]|nr:hypothetical protein EI94DRAFT_1698606 [Lactarius quietus]